MVRLDGKEYVIVDTIGKGVYGTVYKVRCDNETYAMKVISITTGDYLENSTLRETTILQHLDHPNIVKPISINRVGAKIYIILPYIGPTLRNRKVIYPQVKNVMWQLFTAILHMESKGVMHRDIKSTNIVMGNDHVPVIIDFSISTIERTSNNTNVVTPMYRCPDLYHSLEYDHRIDIWSMGVIMYNIITGNDLFPYGGSSKAYLSNVLSSYEDGKNWTSLHNVEAEVRDGPLLNHILSLIPSPERDLLSYILRLHYQEIPSIHDILTHPYFSGYTIPSYPRYELSLPLTTRIYQKYTDTHREYLYADKLIRVACMYLVHCMLDDVDTPSVDKNMSIMHIVDCAIDIYHVLKFSLTP